MMETAHVPMAIGKVLMGVFIASFAGTTLDTAVRLQRYITSELAGDLKLTFLQNKWSATTFAVVTAGGLAFVTGADGQGAMVLWPLFGAINQLLAALALLVITMYLRQTRGWGFLLSAIPCVFMLCVTVWALVIKTGDFYRQQDALLMGVSAVIMVLSLWIFVETVLVFIQKKPAVQA
jgi:carbon starvation protein